jgi:predicted TIM-barrel fold metal-dependent hydrolase
METRFLTRRNLLTLAVGTAASLARLAGAQSVPWSAGTEAAKPKAPPHATDCHHHIYDSRFPVDPRAALHPDDASVGDYRLLQRRIGTSRNVVVQPSTYGIDNGGLIAALQAFGPSARGIAVVDTTVSDVELQTLHAAGVRGIRFNVVAPGGVTSIDMVAPLAKRIAALRWHVQVFATADLIAGTEDLWRGLPCDVVFDHLGHVPRVDHPAFGVIQRLMHEGRAWVKLSGAYIGSTVGPPTYADRSVVARAFVKAAAGRCLWGSDWPHPTERPDHKPDDAILFDLLADWAPDPSIRQRILVDNPAKPYGFT